MGEAIVISIILALAIIGVHLYAQYLDKGKLKYFVIGCILILVVVMILIGIGCF